MAHAVPVWASAHATEATILHPTARPVFQRRTLPLRATLRARIARSVKQRGILVDLVAPVRCAKVTFALIVRAAPSRTASTENARQALASAARALRLQSATSAQTTTTLIQSARDA